MLATLNLQLSPVELLDDTLTSTAPLLPDAGGEVESGFAGLLRLRVDASLPSDPTGGEVLPPDGSDLPILSHLLATEAAAESAPAPEIATDASNPELVKLMPQLTVEGDATTLAGRPDIVLEDAVIYPPLNEAPAEVPASLLLAPPLQSPNAARPDAAAAQVAAQVAAGGRDAGDTLVPRPALPDGPPTTRPELAARIQDVLTFAGDRPAIPAASTGLLGRGQIEMPQTGTSLAATPTATTAPATVPAAITAPATQIDERLPLVDLPKRPDILPLQSAAGLDDAVSEIVQARGTVPNPVQALHAQLNTQPSQALFTASPGTVAAGESTYAAGVQQATDLIGTSVRDSAWGERIGERVLMMAGKYEEAVDHLNRSLAIEQDAFFLANLGISFYYLGDYERAVHQLRRAADASPNEASIWLSLGDAMRFSMQSSEAVNAYREAMRLAREEDLRLPSSPANLYRLAWATAGLSAVQTAKSPREAKAQKSVGFFLTACSILY